MEHDYQIEALEQVSGANTLVCSTCGHQFVVQKWQPSLCCPACNTIGYPDRAGMHLLSQAWNCAQCGTTNNGLHNFCTECGTGLASRCLRCEHPVYSAICLHCGTHQAQLQRFRNAQAERTHWQPLISGYAQEQAASSVDDTSRQTLRQKTRQQFRLSWGWIWILSGILLMAIVVAPEVVGIITVPDFSLPFKLNPDSLKVLWGSVQSTLQTRLQVIFDMLSALSDIKPGDADYPLLLGGIIFVASLFPLLVYFIGRIIRRIFS